MIAPYWTRHEARFRGVRYRATMTYDADPSVCRWSAEDVMVEDERGEFVPFTGDTVEHEDAVCAALVESWCEVVGEMQVYRGKWGGQ